MPTNPNHTPAHSIRVPTPLWRAAMAAASAEGRTVTDVVIERLTRLVRKHERKTSIDVDRVSVESDYDY